jgi:hypothetical protein
MKHFNISYTSAYNRRHKRNGHLYQGRYKAFLIDADNYLLAVSRYIHLNPIRLKKYSGYTANEQWEELQKYADSSLAGYCSESRKEEFVQYPMVLEYMGGDSRKGRKGYKQFMQEGICQGGDSPLIMGRGSGIIGETEFIEWIKAKVLGDTGDKREQPALMKLRKSLEPEAVMAGFVEITANRQRSCVSAGAIQWKEHF